MKRSVSCFQEGLTVHAIVNNKHLDFMVSCLQKRKISEATNLGKVSLGLNW